LQVQRRCRITACRRLDQRLEIGEQRGVLGNRRFASGSRPPDPLRGLVSRQFLQTPPDRARRNPGCHRDRRDPAITRGERLGRRDQTAAPFIEKRGHRRKPLSDGSDIDHYHNMVFERGCKSMSNSIKTRFDNFRTGPKLARTGKEGATPACWLDRGGRDKISAASRKRSSACARRSAASQAQSVAAQRQRLRCG